MLLICSRASFGLVLRVGTLGIISILALRSDQLSTLVDYFLLVLTDCQPSTCLAWGRIRIRVCILFTLFRLCVSKGLF